MAGCTPSLCSRTFTVGEYRRCPYVFRRGGERGPVERRRVERGLRVSRWCTQRPATKNCSGAHDDCCSVKKNSPRDPQFADKKHPAASGWDPLLRIVKSRRSSFVANLEIFIIYPGDFVSVCRVCNKNTNIKFRMASYIEFLLILIQIYFLRETCRN